MAKTESAESGKQSSGAAKLVADGISGHATATDSTVLADTTVGRIVNRSIAISSIIIQIYFSIRTVENRATDRGAKCSLPMAKSNP